MCQLIRLTGIILIAQLMIVILSLSHISLTTVSGEEMALHSALDLSRNIQSNAEVQIPDPSSDYIIQLQVTNYQPISTPSPFQQVIVLTQSEIGSQVFNSILSDPLNVLFYEQGVGNLYAWLESFNSTTMIWWVKLPNGIPAGGSVTISAEITTQNNFPFTGVSPLAAEDLALSPGYDNGGNVFNYYQSFANLNAVPPGWGPIYNSSLSTITFSRYYTGIEPITSYTFRNSGLISLNSLNLENQMVNMLAQVPVTNGTGFAIMILGAGEANNANTYAIGPGGGLLTGLNSDGMAFSYCDFGEPGIMYLHVGYNEVGNVTYKNEPTTYSFGFSSQHSYFYLNNTLIFSYNGVPGTFQLPLVIAQQDDGENLNLYSVFISALPPNGIMPSVSSSVVITTTLSNQTNGISSTGSGVVSGSHGTVSSNYVILVLVNSAIIAINLIIIVVRRR
ncbi:hypothetical protein [Metallosphaera javensis (ex Sakai et al. 2022)]|uniref:hypothetical protein n=1 Tax=Metallosphaera javensis (ex Sakai et al. 2022) TaxID=2775498 RepID=UPI00258CDCE3